MSEKTVVHTSGEAQAFWMLGGLYEMLLSSDETNGAVTVMQMTVPAGMGPPPHTHPGTETVCVLDGTLNYEIGGETFAGGPGATFFISEGIVERFDPSTEVKVLITYTPGGIERFFA